MNNYQKNIKFNSLLNLEKQSGNPSISIGICTSNDDTTINNLLKVLVRNLIDSELNILEIIIVSSGCVDKTELIIEDYIKKYPQYINVIKESKRKGKASALNLIFDQFLGDALVLVPADVMLSNKSLHILKRKLFSNASIGLVSGRPMLSFKSPRVNKISKMCNFLWQLHNQTLNLKYNTHATGELMILRRNVVNQIPNYIINDDAFIALETLKNNFHVDYEKNAFVFISIPNTLKDYIIQRKRVILGHKQLKYLTNRNTTTFKEIFKTNKILSIKILLKELNNFNKIFYFSLALIIESYIEINLHFSNEQILKANPVWDRIKTLVAY